MERLKENIPLSLSTRDGARAFFESKLSIEELERQKLSLIVDVLNRPELSSLIDEGKITLGIIKPSVDQGRYDSPLTDNEAAEKILEEIGKEKIVFKISLVLTREQAEKFYSVIKDKYSVEIWEAIVSHASSGPLTWMLIYDENGEAIAWWREKMGNTYPTKASPESIRGKYAIEEKLPNNLVHGSDQKSEVKRELGVLKEALEALLR